MDISANWDIVIPYLPDNQLFFVNDVTRDSNNNLCNVYISRNSITGTSSIVVTKIGVSGIKLWEKIFNTSTTVKDSVNISVDSNDDLYISYTDSSTAGSARIFSFDGCNGNIILFKVDGSNGNQIWTKTTVDFSGNQVNPSYNQSGSLLSLRTDNNNNVIMLYTTDMTANTTATDISLDVVVTSVDSSGNLNWVLRDDLSLNSHLSQEKTYRRAGLEVDSNNNVYVAYSTSGNIGRDASNNSPNQEYRTQTITYDVNVVKIDPSNNDPTIIATNQSTDINFTDPSVNEIASLSLDFINGELYMIVVGEKNTEIGTDVMSRIHKLDKDNLSSIWATQEFNNFEATTITAGDNKLYAAGTKFSSGPPPPSSTILLYDISSSTGVIDASYTYGITGAINDPTNLLYRGMNDIYLSYTTLVLEPPFISNLRVAVLRYSTKEYIMSLLPRRWFGMNFSVYEKKGYPRAINMGYGSLNRRRR